MQAIVVGRTYGSEATIGNVIAHRAKIWGRMTSNEVDAHTSLVCVCGFNSQNAHITEMTGQMTVKVMAFLNISFE
jgi:hypothetical protein